MSFEHRLIKLGRIDGQQIHQEKPHQTLPSHITQKDSRSSTTSGLKIGASLDARNDLREGDKEHIIQALGQLDYRETDPVQGGFQKLNPTKVTASKRLHNIIRDMQNPAGRKRGLDEQSDEKVEYDESLASEEDLDSD